MDKNYKKYLDNIMEIARAEGYDSLDNTYVEHLRARFFDEDVVIGKTDRITLREIKLSDLEAFYEFEDADTESVLAPFLKETKETSKENLKVYIETMYPLYDYGIWTVVEREKKEIIGLCGLGQTEFEGELCTDLGYYICPQYRRQGLASECIQIVLDYAKNYLEFPLIYAIIKEENTISRGILRKFGFEQIRSCEEPIVFRKNLME